MKTITEAEWNQAGERLFGPDRMTWRFACPICGNVATPEDFRPYQDQGATPDRALCECIGRYMPREKVRQAFGERADVPKPCDYAGYGLIRVSPVGIVRDDGAVTHCFAFADEEAQAQTTEGQSQARHGATVVENPTKDKRES